MSSTVTRSREGDEPSAATLAEVINDRYALKKWLMEEFGDKDVAREPTAAQKLREDNRRKVAASRHALKPTRVS